MSPTDHSAPLFDSQQPPTGVYQLSLQQTVHFGPNRVDELPEVVDRREGNRVFVVANRATATQTPIVKGIVDLLGRRIVGVYDEVSANASPAVVLEAARSARRLGADFLVSIGSGSAIDVTKAVAMCLADRITSAEVLRQYRLRVPHADVQEMEGEVKNFDGGQVFAPRLGKSPLPHVSVSTTLAAAEYRGTVGLNDEGETLILMDERLTPVEAILDPLVTQYTPPSVWSSTGMRAVDHCVESYLSATRTPFAAPLASAALAELRVALPASRNHPQDYTTRGRCQVASWMSIWAGANGGMGLSHALSDHLCAFLRLPLGIGSALTLPAVMEFNLPMSAERQAALAPALGVEPHDRLPQEVANDFIAALRAIIHQLSLPATIMETGRVLDDPTPIVGPVLRTHFTAANPRPVKADDVRSILRRIR